MEDDDVRFTLDYVLELRSLAAGLIEIRVQIIDVGRIVELRGQITPETSQRIFETGTFHVDEADDPPAWDMDKSIDIVLRLRKPLVKMYSSAEGLYNELFTDEESPLRHTEAWLLLEAMQDVEVPGQPDATASFGVRTDWADPLF